MEKAAQRFAVALSFAGEARGRVAEIARRLANACGQKRILYDRFHEAEFARPNLDVYLQHLYHEDTLLNVVFLSSDYERKQWCGLEWRAIRDLIKRRREDVMLLRLDDADVAGVLSVDGYIDIRGRSDDDVAKLILERLALCIGSARRPVEPPINANLREMTSPENKEQHVWKTFAVPGSALTDLKGLCGTPNNKVGYTPESFSGESTVVLGAPKDPPKEMVVETEASWNVTVDPQYIHYFKRGFVFIGCMRFFGGLHSTIYNCRAAVFLNKKPIDFIDLRLMPEHHSDYFHRVPVPVFPRNSLVSNCQTLYAWPILRDKVLETASQTVSVRVDAGGWWDIDYVGLVIEAVIPKSRVFLAHGSGDKKAIRELYQQLKGERLNPWLDEEDLLPGQDWKEAIENAIRSSAIVLVCLSEKSVNRAGYLQKEIVMALDKADEQPEGTLFIIPVRLDRCEVPKRLSKWQFANLFDDSGRERLISVLRKTLGLEHQTNDDQL